MTERINLQCAANLRTEQPRSLGVPVAPQSLTLDAASFHIAAQYLTVPQTNGGPIMPEGFLTSTGLLLK